MNSVIERTLASARTRPLSSIEIDRLYACIHALENRSLPREDVLVGRIEELEGQLADCRARVRKCEHNGYPD